MSFKRTRKTSHADLTKAMAEVTKRPKHRIHIIVDRPDYEEFKILTLKRGTNPSEILNKFIKEYIEDK